jgi:hypothetical protein
MRVITVRFVETSSSFEDWSKDKQAAYIKRHPGSKYAKNAAAKKSSAKPAKPVAEKKAAPKATAPTRNVKKTTHNVKVGKWDNTNGGKTDHDAGGLLKGVTGAQLNSLGAHYFSGKGISELKNSTKKSLKDAYANIKEDFPNLTDSALDKKLKKHFSK